MISLAEYLEDPCGKLSIPYWKARTLVVPENIKVVHDRDFSESLLGNWTDERYFRLRHTMENLRRTILPDFNIVTAGPDDWGQLVSIINRSYPDLHVSQEQLKRCRETAVYRRDLWLLVREINTGIFVGSGIADFDAEAGELSLEWIQVLPEYRRRRIGQAIVSELLFRGQGAKFATVSGKLDNRTKPEALYRRCGFTGNDIWHVLSRGRS